MGNFLEGTEGALKQKTMAEKVAETASVSLSNESWAERHAIAKKALETFGTLDANGDSILTEKDFDNADERLGEFYTSERNAIKYLKNNYYVVRDLYKDDERGISRSDVQMFYDVTKPNFSARRAATWDTLHETGFAIANTLATAAALVFIFKTGDAPPFFAPILATGGFVSGGVSLMGWSNLGARTDEYNKKRAVVGQMTLPKNLER